MDGWRSIATAPSGEDILVWLGTVAKIARRDGQEWWSQDGDYIEGGFYIATHWMPLPPQPETDE